MITPDAISYGNENEQISKESFFSVEGKKCDNFYDTIKNIKDNVSGVILSLPNIKKMRNFRTVKKYLNQKIIPVKDLNYEKALKLLGEYIEFGETFERLKKGDLIIYEKKGKYYIEGGEYMYNIKIPKKIVKNLHF